MGSDDEGWDGTLSVGCSLPRRSFSGGGETASGVEIPGVAGRVDPFEAAKAGPHDKEVTSRLKPAPTTEVIF